MSTSRDDIRREFNRLLSSHRALGDWPDVDFREGTYDSVVDVACVQLGACRDDDLRPATVRARRLFAMWVLECALSEFDGKSQHTNYVEQAERMVEALLTESANRAERIERLEGERPEFCARCARHQVSGKTRAELTAQRSERESIERELGLR